ncbi:MAG: beta-hydroxyacyl-ACP dehydratase [Deltaproteobacteria bacterium]|nr:beta-hydroxyacyl-ACP dehydratase [Deltaproteobacteria bacterium]
MRFILVDRIIKIEDGQGSFLKNVSQSEDYFSDHFPDSPIMPGVLILECFYQAAQLLVARNHDFILYPELQQVLRASFRHQVIPGDQLQVALRLVNKGEKDVVIKAQARAREKLVAEATLKFGLMQREQDAETEAHCQRLEKLYDLLSSDPADRAWDDWAKRLGQPNGR